MSDVDDYAKLIGPTPSHDSNGLFQGQSDEDRNFSNAIRYITKVWIYENTVSDLADELVAFDFSICERAREQYEVAGGNAHMGFEGGTLYETWAAHQLFLRKRHSILLSEGASIPIDAAPRVILLSQQELLDVLETLLPVHSGTDVIDEVQIPSLMNIGNAGHVIQLRSRSAALDEIRYWDTWPGPSLLCDANNKMGIEAKLVRQKPIRWRITAEEYVRAVCALIVPISILSWTKYGENLCSYKTLKEGDLFKFFRLREKNLFSVSDLLQVQSCTTKAKGHDVILHFFISENDIVRLARIQVDSSFAGKYPFLFADLIKCLFMEFEPAPYKEVKIEDVMKKIMLAVKTGEPQIYTCTNLQASLHLVNDEGNSHIIAEILPA